MNANRHQKLAAALSPAQKLAPDLARAYRAHIVAAIQGKDGPVKSDVEGAVKILQDAGAGAEVAPMLKAIGEAFFRGDAAAIHANARAF